MNAQDFIEKVKQECKQNNIKCEFTPYNEVNADKMRVSGYFSEDDKVLRVATGGDVKDWLPVLVHEYAHLKQYIEKEPLFDIKIGNQSGYCLYIGWLTKEIELSPHKLAAAFEATVLCERNCEQRVLRIIKQYNLPINTGKYAREANCFLYLYHLALKYRNPHIKSSSFFVEKVLSKMPEHLRNKHYNHIPPEIEEVLEEYYADLSLR